ncbi:MAG: thiamine phosphate synthase [Proteobacteria bacterium]|nr:thiamine phosphate synthase [Pseudomonadota bacterium]
MIPFDLSLYLVADQEFCRRPGIEAIVAAALAGGASMVQLRGTRANLRQLLADALVLRALTRDVGIPLVINDHVDIALASGADGVHVGQTDMPAPFARQLLGKDKIIGLSVTCAEDFSDRDLAFIDYVGLGPVFPTQSKPDAAPALGLSGFSAIRRQIRCPVVAIGGIKESNAANVISAGADGIAIVSAICCADDPRGAAASLKRKVMEARQ